MSDVWYDINISLVESKYIQYWYWKTSFCEILNIAEYLTQNYIISFKIIDLIK